MIEELERIWKETVVAKSKYCPGVFLEVLRKLSKDNRSPGRDSNRPLPEYVTATLACSVCDSNNELETMWREAVVAHLEVVSLHLPGEREVTKTLSQHTWCLN
jgi:Zn ribbon nucleic-acid-binding protein